MARKPSPVAAVHPVSGIPASVWTRHTRASASRQAPGRSSATPVRGPSAGTRTTSASTPTTAAGATLRKNTDRQPNCAASAPPTIGPAAAATPMALVRSAIGIPSRSRG